VRNPNSPQVSSFAAAETARRVHEACILELQGSGLRVVRDIVLEDGIERPIAHKLGRAPVWCAPSAPRGPISSGRIEEIRSTNDRTQIAILKATGYGGPITVDVAFL